MSEIDILERADQLLGETDGEGHGWGGIYDIINIIEEFKSELKASRDLVDECKRAGTYDAAMHKRDKKQLEKLKKQYKDIYKDYLKSQRDYISLDNKYTEICSAYSGVPLQHIPMNPTLSIVQSIDHGLYCSSDAGASYAREEAEKKLELSKRSN